MRVNDQIEWKLLNGLHPHLIWATEDAIKRTHVIEDEASADDDNIAAEDLRDTLKFLHYELRNVAIAVPTHRNLASEVCRRFNNATTSLLHSLDAAFSLNTRSLMEELKMEEKSEFELDNEFVQSLRQHQGWSCLQTTSEVVSQLQDFNKEVERLFQVRSRIESRILKAPVGKGSHWSGSSPALKVVRFFLDDVRTRLLRCKGTETHHLLLQATGESFAEPPKRSLRLYISACKFNFGWQEVHYSENSDADPQSYGKEIQSLCAAILESQCYQEVLKLSSSRAGRALCKLPQSMPRSTSAAPKVTLGDLLRTKHFSPITPENPVRAFLPYEKRKLTLNLAWTFVHLFGCEATDGGWSADKIYSLTRPREHQENVELLGEEPPYLTCDGVGVSAPPRTSEASIWGDSVFLDFAKLLVEIETGTKVTVTEKSIQGEPSMWLTIANIIEEHKLPTACIEYENAIEGCLQLHREINELDDSENSSHSTSRKYIYDNIVKHLIDDFGHYRSRNLKRNWDIAKDDDKAGSLQTCNVGSKPVSRSDQLQATLDLACQMRSTGGQVTMGLSTPSLVDAPTGNPAKRMRRSAESKGNKSLPVRRSTRLSTQAENGQPAERRARKTPTASRRIASPRGNSRRCQVFDDITDALQDPKASSASEEFISMFENFIDMELAGDDASNFESDDEQSRVVKVCIIDTGLNPSHPTIQAANRSGRIKSVNSWKGDSTDTYGHGTHVADLILRLAPMCNLYVAKVSDEKFMAEGDFPLIAEAIKWALSLDVDVISMSIGIDSPDPAIDSAVRSVVSAGKIFLSAAGNHGSNGPRAYPSDMDGIICVHASNGKGKDGHISPSALDRDDNFMTLGISVPLTDGGRQIYRTGTSYATPIAAAIAANTLSIVSRFDLNSHQQQRLFSAGGMKRLFRQMSPHSDNGYNYVAPWNLWMPKRTQTLIRELILEALNH